MSKSHEISSAVSPKAACSLWVFLWLTLAIPAHPYTVEAEFALEILREKKAAGLLGEADYLEFLSQLNTTDNCKTWVELRREGSPALFRDIAFSSEIRQEIEALCSEPQASKPGPVWQGQGKIQQTYHPGKAIYSLPSGEGEISSSFGIARLGFSQNEIRDRRFEISQHGFHVFAGHISRFLSPTQLDFISGQAFYQGCSRPCQSGSGFSGPWASTKPSLEGMGIGFLGKDWSLQTAGAWNRWSPKQGSSDLQRETVERRDARFLHLGLAWKKLRLQAIQNHFETPKGPVAEAWIGGAEISDISEKLALGLAVSRWNWDEVENPDRPRRSEVGCYGEINLRLPGSYLLELSQSSPTWKNLLERPIGKTLDEDTGVNPWKQQGQGKGHLYMQSQILMGDYKKYRADLKNGAQVVWKRNALGEYVVVSAEPRLALLQSLGPYTYTLGTGFHFKRQEIEYYPDPPVENSQEETVHSGIGHILTWNRNPWRIKLTYTQSPPLSRNRLPEPVAFTVNHSGKPWAGQDFRLTCLLGDWRYPTEYFKVIAKQEWFLSPNLRLQNLFKLPWKKNQGWSGELSYRLGLLASF